MISRVNQRATFLLRKVDYATIVSKYNQSYYSTMTLPTSDDKTKKAISSGMTNRPIQPIFNPLSLGNVTHTSGDNVYKDLNGNVHKDGKYRCHWDRCMFTGVPWGIPVSKVSYGKIDHYTLDGCYCTPQCALAAIRENFKMMSNYRNPMYDDSEQLLLYLCYTLDDSKKLIPANDWRIIQENGGSMTIDEYRHHMVPYVRTGNFTTNYVKFEYLRLR